MPSKPCPATISARDVLDLLRCRHSEDVFVDECKDGPTHGRRHLRLDAWAMRRSWVNACISGYEIKVARSDFVRDDKWRGYLPLVNEFYFVAPRGVVDKDELAPEAGLLEVSKNCRRLTCRKKAMYTDAPDAEMAMRYILMSRVKIFPPNFYSANTLEDWQLWLASRKRSKEIGYEVRCRLSEDAKQVVLDAVRAAGKAVQDCKRWEKIQKWLERNGFDVDGTEGWQLDRARDNMKKLIPDHVRNKMAWLRDCLDTALLAIDAAEAAGEDEEPDNAT